MQVGRRPGGSRGKYPLRKPALLFSVILVVLWTLLSIAHPMGSSGGKADYREDTALRRKHTSVPNEEDTALAALRRRRGKGKVSAAVKDDHVLDSPPETASPIGSDDENIAGVSLAKRRGGRVHGKLIKETTADPSLGGRLIARDISVEQRMELYKHHDKQSLAWLRNQATHEVSERQKEQKDFQDVQRKRKEEESHRGMQPPPPPGDSFYWMNCHCTEFSLGDQRGTWCGAMRHSISSSHVCVVTNACFDKARRIYVAGTDSNPTSRTAGVTINLANTANLGLTVVFNKNETDIRRRGREDSGHIQHSDLIDSSNYAEGDHTVILLGHSATSHITHFLEPIGNMQMAIATLMKGRYPKEGETFASPAVAGSCADEDPKCFHPPNTVLSNRANVGRNSWQEHVLRVAMADHEGKAGFFKSGEIPVPNDKLRCFKKLVVPGAFYGLWPQGQDTRAFHDSLLQHLEQLKPASSHNSLTRKRPAAYIRRGREMEDVPLMITEDPSAKLGTGGDRVILIADRRSKRYIVDMADLKAIVEEVADTVNATVKIVQFGARPFSEQAGLANEAGVLMGIHGADLTNMIFQKRGSVVIEMNPLFFFENRFFELANALHLTYLAWTCSTHLCAFGGDERRFSTYSSSHKIAYNDNDFSLKGKDNDRIHWNWVGYTGMACPQCNQAACCGSLKNGYYSTLRDSNIKVGPQGGKHAKEIQAVLKDAFGHLGWTPVI